MIKYNMVMTALWSLLRFEKDVYKTALLYNNDARRIVEHNYSPYRLSDLGAFFIFLAKCRQV